MSEAPTLMPAAARERFRAALDRGNLDDLNQVAAKHDINGPFSNEEWHGESLLEYEIRKDNPEHVRLLLEAGADFRRKFRDRDRSAVSVSRAAKYAGFDVFKLLADAGAPYELNDLLPAACRRGDRQFVQFLLDKGADPNLPEALGEAVLGRHPELVRQLIGLGADVNKSFRSLVNFLPVTAATESRSPRALTCLELVLDAGADPNAVAHRKHNFTALYGASGNGSPEMVRRLMAAGADPNVLVWYGGTPLLHAIKEWRRDNLVTLLVHGADPNLRHSENLPPKYLGKSPLEVARETGRFHMLPYLEAAAAGESIPDNPSAIALIVHQQLVDALSDPSLGRSRTLRPGASHAEILAFETPLGISLPNEFKAWYQIANGQPEDSDPLIIYYNMGEIYKFYRLMSLKEIQRERTSMINKLADSPEGWGDTSLIPDHERRRSVWWHERWIPIASDFNGMFIIMDLAPTDEGIPGQIIVYDLDEGPGDVIADSLLQWLETFTDSIHR